MVSATPFPIFGKNNFQLIQVTMKTILVPTDFSKCANNAMMYALEIAARTDRSITVLYVVYPNEGVDNNMYDAFFVDNYVQQRLDGMKIRVKKFTRSPHLKDVKIQIECRIGFPSAPSRKRLPN